MSFFRELKRRNVLRVAAAYALVAWILIEAGSVLLPTFGAPEWFFKVYVIIVMAGFVVSMIIAWVFEITPDGVRLERDVDRETYRKPSRGRANAWLIGLLIIALGVSLTFNLSGMRDRQEESAASGERPSIAVLPFTSLSTDPDNRFFTDGIHADLLTRLSESGSFRVTSGTSVAEYRDSTRNVREIGRELGVGAVVEGAIQRSGDQVRIMVQLIDTGRDEPIWADNFDRELTMQNVFEIQSQISAQIAASLRAALSPARQQRLAHVPTRNVEAYAQYVEARNNLYLRSFESLRRARTQFERAIELDPEYAQAWAGLAETVMVLMINHNALAPGEAFDLAEAATARALQFDPDLADAHAVQGLIEFTQWKQTRSGTGNQVAAASFERAIELNPSLAYAYVWYSALREAELDLDGAIDLLSQAIAIDPLGRIPYVNLPGLFAAQGRSDEAIRTWLKAIAIFPEWATPVQYLAEHLERLGRLDEALAWHYRAVEFTDDPMADGPIVGIYNQFGMEEPLRDWIRRFPPDHPLFPLARGYEQFVYGNYAAALADFEALPNFGDMPTGYIYPLMAASAIFLGEYDKAFDYIARLNPTLLADADDVVNRFNIGAALMLAYVQQKRGYARDAVRILEQADTTVAAMPRLGRSGHGIRDAQIYALQGRKEAALDRLEDAVDEGFVSLTGFELWDIDVDPLIETLRDDPRFKVLRQRMSDRIAVMRRSVEAAQESGDWNALRSRVETT